MTQPFNISMLLRADASQAKGTLADFERSLQRAAAETGKVKSALDAEATAMDKVAAAAARATTAKRGLTMVDRAAAINAAATSSALTQAIQQAAGTSRLSINQTATTAQAARAPIEGLTKSMSGLTSAMLQDAEASRQYRAALDDIRAAYNPLFAASRQYERTLDGIAEAEKLGAISAREAAAARERAAAKMAPVGQRHSVGGAPTWITGNLAAQGNDIVMMAMAGQNPLQLALQQGTQISQVLNELPKGTSIISALGAGIASMLNPVSLLTIGLIAAGTFGLQALGSLIPKAKSLSEAVGDLTASVDAYRSAVTQLRSGDLSATFGASAEAARALLADLAAMERRIVTLNAKAGMGAIASNLQDSWMKTAFDPRRKPRFMQMFDVSIFDQDGGRKAAAVQTAAKAAMQAEGIDAQIAALEKLVDLWQIAAEHSGEVTAEENEQAKLIATTLADLYKARALDENAAGKAAATQMADELERQAAMAQTVAQYGQNSAEARMLELQQQRQITVAKLEAMGLDAKAPEYQKNLTNLQIAHDARERSIRDERARAHADQLAALTLEGRLIGATTEERLRAKEVAAAQLEADRNSLSPLERALEITRAITRASVEAANERAKAMFDLQTGLMTDAVDAQLGLARDPVTKADLQARREYIRVLRETGDATQAQAEADRTRARAMAEASGTARMQIADLMDEVAIRQRVSVLVANGAIQASQANAAIQQELQLRPLVAAAARAEGAEKARLTEIITGLRIAYEAQAAEERRTAQNDYLRTGAERLQQARLELALVGQTAAVRARVLALVQAERDIRQLGLTDQAADRVRRDAEELSGLNLVIERQAEAWKRVQGAGEAAIDAVLDKLKGGDLGGAFAGLLDELNKGFFDLAVRNPLKNLILGTNLGTIDDIGGLSGIWDRLTGKAPLDTKSVVAQASAQVQAMQIAASMVTINAAALSGAGVGGAFAAANLPYAPGAAGPLALPGATAGVARQIWDFFSGKGLAAHQVAAILGHAKAESGFNPLAAGDHNAAGAAQAFGLFQWNDRKDRLFSHIGGRQNLGDVTKQLEFMWHEFMTSENRPFRNLIAAPDLQSATWAMQGFERPSGYKPAVMGSGMHWDKRLAAAEQAMTTFAGSVRASTGQMDQMGTGMGKLGTGMGQMSQGMDQVGGTLGQLLSGVAGSIGGKAGGFLQLLIGVGSQMADGVPLFSGGGWTGAGHPDQPAGIVHAGEFVINAEATKRIGVANLEALQRGTMRGFRSGGYVGSAPSATAPAANSPAGPGAGGFVANFDLRGAQDPQAVEAAARRGMRAALEEYRAAGLGSDVRRIVGKPRSV
ncbi:phage tail tip lysozyme [Paracoccus sp. p3-h83]|uniref:phage tail tip lysozyme n=1 Tax=Paracoccus sp. p3-h83 TaxID=3342805 RepID=UPI0035B888EB